jgi:hypothetical protein
MSELISIESIGWVATIVVVASYFFSNPVTLRLVQIGGASLWLAYGVVIDSAPVIVANALVLSAASWSVLRARRTGRRGGGETPSVARREPAIVSANSALS